MSSLIFRVTCTKETTKLRGEFTIKKMKDKKKYIKNRKKYYIEPELKYILET